MLSEFVYHFILSLSCRVRSLLFLSRPDFFPKFLMYSSSADSHLNGILETGFRPELSCRRHKLKTEAKIYKYSKYMTKLPIKKEKREKVKSTVKMIFLISIFFLKNKKIKTESKEVTLRLSYIGIVTSSFSISGSDAKQVRNISELHLLPFSFLFYFLFFWLVFRFTLFPSQNSFLISQLFCFLKIESKYFISSNIYKTIFNYVLNHIWGSKLINLWNDYCGVNI